MEDYSAVFTVLLVVVTTTLWVLVDSIRIGVKKDLITGFFNMGKTGWVLSCLGCWILAFPAYLIKWDAYKQARQSPTRQCPFCAERILSAAQKCKHCGEFVDGRTEGEGV